MLNVKAIDLSIQTLIPGMGTVAGFTFLNTQLSFVRRAYFIRRTLEYLFL